MVAFFTSMVAFFTFCMAWLFIIVEFLSSCVIWPFNWMNVFRVESASSRDDCGEDVDVGWTERPWLGYDRGNPRGYWFWPWCETPPWFMGWFCFHEKLGWLRHPRLYVSKYSPLDCIQKSSKVFTCSISENTVIDGQFYAWCMGRAQIEQLSTVKVFAALMG